jgi:hypothetical protein
MGVGYNCYHGPNALQHTVEDWVKERDLNLSDDEIGDICRESQYQQVLWLIKKLDALKLTKAK